MRTTSIARQPLAQLARELAAWAHLLRSGGLRRGDGPDDPGQDVRASDELERFREPAKAIIIWLELCGRDADAAEVDDAMAGCARSRDDSTRANWSLSLRSAPASTCPLSNCS